MQYSTKAKPVDLSTSKYFASFIPVQNKTRLLLNVPLDWCSTLYICMGLKREFWYISAKKKNALYQFGQGKKKNNFQFTCKLHLCFQSLRILLQQSFNGLPSVQFPEAWVKFDPGWDLVSFFSLQAFLGHDVMFFNVFMTQDNFISPSKKAQLTFGFLYYFFAFRGVLGIS